MSLNGKDSRGPNSETNRARSDLFIPALLLLTVTISIGGWHVCPVEVNGTDICVTLFACALALSILDPAHAALHHLRVERPVITTSR